MTDRETILRNADLAMGDIDRVLAPTNTPIDDLVHHPGQCVVNITDTGWYQAYAQGERKVLVASRVTVGDDGSFVIEPVLGRVRYNHGIARKLADRDTRLPLAEHVRTREQIEAGAYRYCWHCRGVLHIGTWSPRDGDDVCAHCRSVILAYADEAAAMYKEAEIDRYVTIVIRDDPEGVDGVPINSYTRPVIGFAAVKHSI